MGVMGGTGSAGTKCDSTFPRAQRLATTLPNYNINQKGLFISAGLTRILGAF